MWVVSLRARQPGIEREEKEEEKGEKEEEETVTASEKSAQS